MAFIVFFLPVKCSVYNYNLFFQQWLHRSYSGEQNRHVCAQSPRASRATSRASGIACDVCLHFEVSPTVYHLPLCPCEIRPCSSLLNLTKHQHAGDAWICPFTSGQFHLTSVSSSTWGCRMWGDGSCLWCRSREIRAPNNAQPGGGCRTENVTSRD